MRYGCALATKSKIYRIASSLGLMVGVALMGAFFMLGQLVTPESSLLNFLSQNDERLRDLLNGFSSWVLLYPEVCVDGFYRAMFYISWHMQMYLSVVAAATFIPKLFAQDIASNAIVIYNSKALGKGDYIFGKLGVAVLLLSSIWLLPIAGAWLVGNAMSPDWSYFYHSSSALVRAMFVNGVSMLTMSVVAMAISSLTRKSGIAIVSWLFYWIVSNIGADVLFQVYDWGQYVSLSQALDSLALSAFRFDLVIENAREMIPFFDYYTRDRFDDLPETLIAHSGVPFGAVLSIAIHLVAGCMILSKRLISS